MAKAKFTTPKGTIVDVDGTPEEIQKFLVIYESTIHKDLVPDKKEKKRIKIEQKKTDTGSKDYILQIVNTIKDCDEAKAIEENIIDRNSQVDKVLLPLYIVHEHMSNEVGLQSGEISKITGDLGIRIKQPNVS